MTQAFNLSQLANNVNTSGQLDATDGLNGLVDNSNLASSGTASSSTYLRGDRTWASIPAGTVTSVTVSPGVGLTGGGTITSSGTVTLALETGYQAIGTYIFASNASGSTTGLTAGATTSGSSLYPASVGGYQAYAPYGGINDNTYYFAGNSSVMQVKQNTFSGTWQSMGASANATGNAYFVATLYVRIA